jgi:hypothetical protein
MVKDTPKDVFFREKFIFDLFKEKDQRRLKRQALITIIWWVLFGVVTFISLAVALSLFYNDFIADGLSESFWGGVIKVLLFFYFMLSIGTFIFLINIKLNVYKKYRDEVFDFFLKEERKYADFKVLLVGYLINITDELIVDPYLENAGVMSAVGELKWEYKELLNELEKERISKGIQD